MKRYSVQISSDKLGQIQDLRDKTNRDEFLGHAPGGVQLKKLALARTDDPTKWTATFELHEQEVEEGKELKGAADFSLVAEAEEIPTPARA